MSLPTAGTQGRAEVPARRYEDKVVAVTGAAGGVGRAAAVRFAREGARVVLVDLDTRGLAEARQAVEGEGAEALEIVADVATAEGARAYVAAAVDHWGGLDCLFNNAGVLGAVRPITDYPEDVFDRVMAVNVRGMWLGIKHAAPALIGRGGGAIVNTASIAGLRGTPNLVAYTVSKHAVIGLTRTAALELARHGVRVNAVCPSPVETAMARALEAGFNPRDPGQAHGRLAGTIPLRRFGTPEEVAALVAFLASDEARYVTGGIYTVDGGAMA